MRADLEEDELISANGPGSHSSTCICIVSTTRPDIACVVYLRARMTHSPEKGDMKIAKRIARYHSIISASNTTYELYKKEKRRRLYVHSETRDMNEN